MHFETWPHFFGFWGTCLAILGLVLLCMSLWEEAERKWFP